MTRTRLSLPEQPAAPRVKEAREIVQAALGEIDNSVVPWAMRMATERDAWSNSRKRSR